MRVLHDILTKDVLFLEKLAGTVHSSLSSANIEVRPALSLEFVLPAVKFLVVAFFFFFVLTVLVLEYLVVSTSAATP